MLLHVDNLRRSYEREHTELEETKRVLIEHKLLVVRISSSFFSSKNFYLLFLFSLIEHKLLVVRTFIEINETGSKSYLQADEPSSSVSRSSQRSTRNRSISVIQPQPTCLVSGL